MSARSPGIVFLIRDLGLGGSQRQLAVLARGLHEKGHRVLVVVFYGGEPLVEELREAGVDVQSLEKKGRWDNLGFLGRLIRLVREERPDVLHGYLVTGNVLTALLKPLFPRGVRVVWGVRNAMAVFDRSDPLWRLFFQIERLLSRTADLIVANSHRGLDYAVGRGFPKDRVTVIPNGIDVRRFCPDAEARRRLRAEWGVAEDEKLIGAVGRLTPVKGHPHFLEAAALLAGEIPAVRFVCVGGGHESYRRELEALAARLGLGERLIWAGARRDMPAVYSALDVLVSSSHGEGFPNVVGEAMACGVPCVVTDAGDSAAIVGETGVVVQPGDPGALVEGLKVILAKDEDRAASEARSRIKENFSVERLVERTEEVLWPKG